MQSMLNNNNKTSCQAENKLLTVPANGLKSGRFWDEVKSDIRQMRHRGKALRPDFCPAQPHCRAVSFYRSGGSLSGPPGMAPSRSVKDSRSGISPSGGAIGSSSHAVGLSRAAINLSSRKISLSSPAGETNPGAGGVAARPVLPRGHVI
jgi:hypothetical protein